MDLNILVRGQSNAILMMEADGWAGAETLVQEVQRLLGFDGVTDRVNLVYDRFDWDSGTAFGGTALIGDWLTARNGDWRQGWAVGSREQALLNEVASLPAAQRDDPTAVLWLHSEYDSARADLTPEEWMSAVRFDAGQLRAAFGQDAADLPTLFISAMPYWGTDQGHQAIRQGMERLTADPGFNARIAARMQDVDLTTDDWDGNAGTVEFGGGHIDGGDAVQTAGRAARALAEAFAAHAKPGSPVALAGGDIADQGPEVIRAASAGANQLRLDVVHDQADGFQPLDPDAAAGLGWSVRGGNATVQGVAAAIEDADTLLVTFGGPVPADGLLFYGHGHGRLAGAGGEGRGNAVYDTTDLPIWVSADGLVIGPEAAPGGGVPEGWPRDGSSGDDRLRGDREVGGLTDGKGFWSRWGMTGPGLDPGSGDESVPEVGAAPVAPADLLFP